MAGHLVALLLLTQHLFYNGSPWCCSLLCQTGSTSGRVKKRGKGHRLPSQAKYVMSVRKFFEKAREKQKSILRDQIVKRTSAACGVGTATVVRIYKEYERNSGLLSSPEKRYTASRVQIVLDDCNVEAIHKEVHAFYGRKEYPTLDSLLGALKDKNLFQGTLWKVLCEMGFLTRNTKTSSIDI